MEDSHLPLCSFKGLCHNRICARKTHSALLMSHCACLEAWQTHRRCKQPISHESCPASPETANLVFLRKCICSCLIATKSSHWVDQNTNLSDCFGCCWPLLNFQVNLLELLTNKFNFGNVVTAVSQGQSKRSACSSCNGQCEGIFKFNYPSSCHRLLKIRLLRLF